MAATTPADNFRRRAQQGAAPMGTATACGGAGPEVAGAWRATRSSPADSAGRGGQPGPAALAAAPSGLSAVRPHAARLRRGGAPRLRPCPEEEAKYLHVYAAPGPKPLGGRAGTVCTRSASPTSTRTQLPPAGPPPGLGSPLNSRQARSRLSARQNLGLASIKKTRTPNQSHAGNTPTRVARARCSEHSRGPRSARAGNPGVPARTGSCHRLPDAGVCGATVSRARA